MKEEEIKKAVYQGILNFSMELKKEMTESIQRYGNTFIFSDVFWREDFAEQLFKYLDGKITNEELKEHLKAKLAYANNRFLNDKTLGIEAKPVIS